MVSPQAEGGLSNEDSCPQSYYGKSILVRFVTEDQKEVGDVFEVPVATTRAQLVSLLVGSLQLLLAATTNETEKAQLTDLIALIDMKKVDYAINSDCLNKIVNLSELDMNIDSTIERTLQRLQQKHEKEVNNRRIDIKRMWKSTQAAATAALDLEKDVFTSENILLVTFRTSSKFLVRPATKQSSSSPGHGEAILDVAFSNDGCHAVSAGGDTTVRLWDVKSGLPVKVIKKLKNWVYIAAFNWNASLLAAAGKDKSVLIHSLTGRFDDILIKGHNQPITSMAWLPVWLLLQNNVEEMNANDNPVDVSNSIYSQLSQADALQVSVLFTGDQGGCVKAWSVSASGQISSLTNNLATHSKQVTDIAFSQHGFLITAGRDREIHTIQLSNLNNVSKITCHAHWVNSIDVSTSYVMGLAHNNPYSPAMDLNLVVGHEAIKNKLRDNMKYFLGPNHSEKVITVSDDGTISLFSWKMNASGIRELVVKKKLTGHTGIINHAQFSPDGTFIASTGFDMTVRLWHADKAVCLHTYRGHVKPVYKVVWAVDSVHFATCSADSTVKIWSIKQKTFVKDLTNHGGDVFAIAWHPGNQCIASGGKDRYFRLWRA